MNVFVHVLRSAPHSRDLAVRFSPVGPTGFASSAVGGLSRLAVGWIKLGIVPERIQAGHPEQNGRHERMHRTLKQDLQPAQDWRGQQRELDRFRHEYNQVRPHEALGMQTPASVYEPSPRPYPARVPEVEYPDRCRCARSKATAISAGRSTTSSSPKCCGASRSDCCPSKMGPTTVYFAASARWRGFDSETR